VEDPKRPSAGKPLKKGPDSTSAKSSPHVNTPATEKPQAEGAVTKVQPPLKTPKTPDTQAPASLSPDSQPLATTESKGKGVVPPKRVVSKLLEAKKGIQVPTQPRPPRVKQPKTSTDQPLEQEESKPKGRKKGRLYRSLQKRSRWHLLGIAVFAVLAGSLMWWYYKNAPVRAINSLKKFELPADSSFDIPLKRQSELDNPTVSEELLKEFASNKISLSPTTPLEIKAKGKRWQIYDSANNRFLFIEKNKASITVNLVEIDNFRIRTSACLPGVLELGLKAVPLLVERYPRMGLSGQIASVILFGEFGDPQGISPAIQATLSDDKVLSAFGCRTLGKLGESVVKPVLSKLGSTPEPKIDTLLEGMARTRSQAALSGLQDIFKSADASVRKISIAKLVYFGENRQAIETLLQAIGEKERPLGDEAVRVFYRLHKEASLNKHADFLLQQVKGRFAQAEDTGVRARLLHLMGIIGSLPGFTQSNSREILKDFKESLRKALSSRFPEEIAAGIYGLGFTEDNESLEHMMALLDHESAEVTESVVYAVNNLNDPEVVQRLLASAVSQSSRQHVLLGIAQILDHYQLHIAKLGLKGKAIQLLLECQKNVSGEAAKALAQTLASYRK
jgi:HEAT repeat protein